MRNPNRLIVVCASVLVFLVLFEVLAVIISNAAQKEPFAWSRPRHELGALVRR